MNRKNNPKKIINKSSLYSGSGDVGTTTLYNCNQSKISKSANIIEALGSLDEINAYLGIVKVFSNEEHLKILINKKYISYYDILEKIQQVLFIIQAEVAGSEISATKENLREIENIINVISKILPPITSFTISGGSILSANLDYSRVLSRRSERRIVHVQEEGIRVLNKYTISYMNRLSSILFAMSRHANYVLSIPEDHPNYNKK